MSNKYSNMEHFMNNSIISEQFKGPDISYTNEYKQELKKDKASKKKKVKTKKSSTVGNLRSTQRSKSKSSTPKNKSLTNLSKKIKKALKKVVKSSDVKQFMGAHTKNQNINSKPHEIKKSKKIKKKRVSIEETVNRQKKKKMVVTVSKKKPVKKTVKKTVKKPIITQLNKKVQVIVSNKQIHLKPKFRNPRVQKKKKKISILKNANKILVAVINTAAKVVKSNKKKKKTNVKKQIKKSIKKAKKNSIASKARKKIMKKKVKKIKPLKGAGGAGAPLNANTAIIKPVKKVIVSTATKVVEKQPLYKLTLASSRKLFKKFSNYKSAKIFLTKNKMLVINLLIIIPILFHMITGRPLINFFSKKKK
jgi:hypothetical protein